MLPTWSCSSSSRRLSIQHRDLLFYTCGRPQLAPCSERGGRAPLKASLLKHARLLSRSQEGFSQQIEFFAASRGRVPLHYKKIRNFWPNSQITHRVAVDSLADCRNQLTNNTLQALHQTFATNQATSQAPQAAPPVRPRRLGDLHYYCASASRRARARCLQNLLFLAAARGASSTATISGALQGPTRVVVAVVDQQLERGHCPPMIDCAHPHPMVKAQLDRTKIEQCGAHFPPVHSVLSSLPPWASSLPLCGVKFSQICLFAFHTRCIIADSCFTIIRRPCCTSGT